MLKIKCYERAGRVLPMRSHIELLVKILEHESRMPLIMKALNDLVQQNPTHPVLRDIMSTGPEGLEAMIRDGWIKVSYDPPTPRKALHQDRLPMESG